MATIMLPEVMQPRIGVLDQPSVSEALRHLEQMTWHHLMYPFYYFSLLRQHILEHLKLAYLTVIPALCSKQSAVSPFASVVSWKNIEVA
jgi:hypothetical protein